MSWLIALDPPAAGAANMALDAALLEAAATGTRVLRLYAWGPPAISFGRNEPASRRYDRAAIASRGLAVVRRPTGGRAVWHHREVTYAVAAPAGTFGNLAETCLEIHSMIADALRALGAGVDLHTAAGRMAPVGAGACFATPAGGEVITAGGRKLVGSAQVRSGDAFLQHGSVLLEAEQDVVADVTVGAADPPVAAGLAELVPAGRATWDAVADAIAVAARRRWSIAPERREIPDAVRRRGEALRPAFSDDAWTWRR